LTCFVIAAGVAQLANAGEVLLEAATFAAVGDWLADLSSVDQNGYNDKLVGRTTASRNHLPRRW